ncbi:acyltransferase family protein [Bradyrhizobium genosp. P]|uniref:acyltransferase family protein n=1 Tax=Bradyrhizobium genosp. P TaxID=83641 RepID=UPI003CE93529
MIVHARRLARPCVNRNRARSARAKPKLFTWTDGLILEFILGVYLGLIYRSGFRVGWIAASVPVLAGLALGYPEFNWPAVFSAGLPAMLIVGGLVLCPPLKDSGATFGLTILGDASYGIYLSHTIVLRPFRDVWARLVDGAWSPLLFFIGGTVVAIVVGCAIHYAIERPTLRLLSRRLRASLGVRSSRAPLVAAELKA